MLREQRAWTDERYCRYLPRLWNPQAKSSITRFFIDLKPEVARDRIKLDKEFIEEFAEGGISKLLNTATRASQPVGVTCKEFIEDVQFSVKALERWYPKAVPNESYIVETCSERFTSAEMLKRIAYAKRSGTSLDFSNLKKMAQLADDHDRIERKAGTNRILRVQSHADLHYPAVAEASVRAIIGDTSHVDASLDDCFEEMLLGMAATEAIRSYNGIPTVRAVSKVMDRMKRAPL